MNRTIDRTKLFFFGVFLIAAAGMWAYHLYYVWPKQDCEADGNWWSPQDRVCATPIPIWRFTGRLPDKIVAAPPAPAARASPAKR